MSWFVTLDRIRDHVTISTLTNEDLSEADDHAGASRHGSEQKRTMQPSVAVHGGLAPVAGDCAGALTGISGPLVGKLSIRPRKPDSTFS
jgi:hypothetical protein